MPSSTTSTRSRCRIRFMRCASRPSRWRIAAQDQRRTETPGACPRGEWRNTMADAHAKHHDYHLVDPSPWPIVGSVAAFLLAVGLISWMHHLYASAPLVFAAGALGVLYTMIGWWRDGIREAAFKWCHTAGV